MGEDYRFAAAGSRRRAGSQVAERGEIESAVILPVRGISDGTFSICIFKAGESELAAESVGRAYGWKKFLHRAII